MPLASSIPFASHTHVSSIGENTSAPRSTGACLLALLPFPHILHPEGGWTDQRSPTKLCTMPSPKRCRYGAECFYGPGLCKYSHSFVKDGLWNRLPGNGDAADMSDDEIPLPDEGYETDDSELGMQLDDDGLIFDLEVAEEATSAEPQVHSCYAHAVRRQPSPSHCGWSLTDYFALYCRYPKLDTVLRRNVRRSSRCWSQKECRRSATLCTLGLASTTRRPTRRLPSLLWRAHSRAAQLTCRSRSACA